MFLVMTTVQAGVDVKDYSKEIKGVWELTDFVIEDGQGRSEDWCEGAHGFITYINNHMSVAINCKSQPEKMLFYSGPYDLEQNTVTHKVQNYSEIGLKQNFKREIFMNDVNHLELSGKTATGGKAIITWKRVERFADDLKGIAGIYRLVKSENQFEGKDGVPFCRAVFGTILFTPNGHASVSLNCANKVDENQNEPADIFGRKYFYFGTYEVQSNEVVVLPENGSEVSHI